MTLTAILPTLRASIPDPIDAQHWPAGTHATITDIVVEGVSLHDLAALCHTPCVHTTATGTTVVVTTVTEAFTDDDGNPFVVLDADLAGDSPAWSQLRLVGRASRAHCVPTTVCRPRAEGAALHVVGEAWLPGDVAAGELLAVPCHRTLTRRDVAAV